MASFVAATYTMSREAMASSAPMAVGRELAREVIIEVVLG
jgi:hypothetical protein